MPAISFSTMRGKILSGEKKQTIRPKNSDYWLRWKKRDRLIGYWKLRTPDNEKLFDSFFSQDPYPIEGKYFSQSLARLDGFPDLAHINLWFQKRYGKDFFDKEFVVIRWE